MKLVVNNEKFYEHEEVQLQNIEPKIKIRQIRHKIYITQGGRTKKIL